MMNISKLKPSNYSFWFKLLVMLVLIALPLFIRDEYYIHSITVVLLYAFLAQAWNMVGGYAGQLSFGHSAFIGTGAYVSTLLFIRWGITPWVGLIIGGLAAAVISIIISYPAFRLRGPYYTLTTLAFAEILLITVTNIENFMGFDIRGAKGLLVPLTGHAPELFQFGHKAYYYYVMLIFLVIITVVNLLIQKTKFGYYLTAIKSDHEAAEAIGINTTKYKLIAAALSAFFCGAGGVFYAQLFLYLDPMRVFGLDMSLEVAMITIIGGRGTLWGPTLGAFLLRPLREITSTLLGGTYIGVHLAVYGALVIIAILFLPRGLIGALSNISRKFSSKPASKDM